MKKKGEYWVGDALTKIAGGLLAGGMVAAGITNQVSIIPLGALMSAILFFVIGYLLMNNYEDNKQ
jgi:hypothetical protein